VAMVVGTKTSVIIIEEVPTVGCPYCGEKHYGWAVSSAADTGKMLQCRRCQSYFRPVRAASSGS